MKDNQKIYLDKVIEFLVRGTDIGGGWFNPPYYHPGSMSGRNIFKLIYLDTFGLLKDNFYRDI
jgi:hypothetical protein